MVPKTKHLLAWAILVFVSVASAQPQELLPRKNDTLVLAVNGKFLNINDNQRKLNDLEVNFDFPIDIGALEFVIALAEVLSAIPHNVIAALGFGLSFIASIIEAYVLNKINDELKNIQGMLNSFHGTVLSQLEVIPAQFQMMQDSVIIKDFVKILTNAKSDAKDLLVTPLLNKGKLTEDKAADLHSTLKRKCNSRLPIEHVVNIVNFATRHQDSISSSCQHSSGCILQFGGRVVEVFLLSAKTMEFCEALNSMPKESMEYLVKQNNKRYKDLSLLFADIASKSFEKAIQPGGPFDMALTGLIEMELDSQAKANEEVKAMVQNLQKQYPHWEFGAILRNGNYISSAPPFAVSEERRNVESGIIHKQRKSGKSLSLFWSLKSSESNDFSDNFRERVDKISFSSSTGMAYLKDGTTDLEEVEKIFKEEFKGANYFMMVNSYGWAEEKKRCFAKYYNEDHVWYSTNNAVRCQEMKSVKRRGRFCSRSGSKKLTPYNRYVMCYHDPRGGKQLPLEYSSQNFKDPTVPSFDDIPVAVPGQEYDKIMNDSSSIEEANGKLFESKSWDSIVRDNPAVSESGRMTLGLLAKGETIIKGTLSEVEKNSKQRFKVKTEKIRTLGNQIEKGLDDQLVALVNLEGTQKKNHDERMGRYDGITSQISTLDTTLKSSLATSETNVAKAFADAGSRFEAIMSQTQLSSQEMRKEVVETIEESTLQIEESILNLGVEKEQLDYLVSEELSGLQFTVQREHAKTRLSLTKGLETQKRSLDFSFTNLMNVIDQDLEENTAVLMTGLDSIEQLINTGVDEMASSILAISTVLSKTLQTLNTVEEYTNLVLATVRRIDYKLTVLGMSAADLPQVVRQSLADFEFERMSGDVENLQIAYKNYLGKYESILFRSQLQQTCEGVDVMSLFFQFYRYAKQSDDSVITQFEKFGSSRRNYEMFVSNVFTSLYSIQRIQAECMQLTSKVSRTQAVELSLQLADQIKVAAEQTTRQMTEVLPEQIIRLKFVKIVQDHLQVFQGTTDERVDDLRRKLQDLVGSYTSISVLFSKHDNKIRTSLCENINLLRRSGVLEYGPYVIMWSDGEYSPQNMETVALFFESVLKYNKNTEEAVTAIKSYVPMHGWVECQGNQTFSVDDDCGLSTPDKYSPMCLEVDDRILCILNFGYTLDSNSSIDRPINQITTFSQHEQTFDDFSTSHFIDWDLREESVVVTISDIKLRVVEEISSSEVKLFVVGDMDSVYPHSLSSSRSKELSSARSSRSPVSRRLRLARSLAEESEMVFEGKFEGQFMRLSIQNSTNEEMVKIETCSGQPATVSTQFGSLTYTCSETSFSSSTQYLPRMVGIPRNRFPYAVCFGDKNRDGVHNFNMEDYGSYEKEFGVQCLMTKNKVHPVFDSISGRAQDFTIVLTEEMLPDMIVGAKVKQLTMYSSENGPDGGPFVVCTENCADESLSKIVPFQVKGIELGLPSVYSDQTLRQKQSLFCRKHPVVKNAEYCVKLQPGESNTYIWTRSHVLQSELKFWVQSSISSFEGDESDVQMAEKIRVAAQDLAGDFTSMTVFVNKKVDPSTSSLFRADLPTVDTRPLAEMEEGWLYLSGEGTQFESSSFEVMVLWSASSSSSAEAFFDIVFNKEIIKKATNSEELTTALQSYFQDYIKNGIWQPSSFVLPISTNTTTCPVASSSLERTLYCTKKPVASSCVCLHFAYLPESYAISDGKAPQGRLQSYSYRLLENSTAVADNIQLLVSSTSSEWSHAKSRNGVDSNTKQNSLCFSAKENSGVFQVCIGKNVWFAVQH